MGATPAGCSGRPLAAKLGYAASMRVLAIDAPANYEELVGALPDGVRFVAAIAPDVRLVHLFVRSRADLAARLAALVPVLAPDAMLWVSWPKKASKVPTDVTEDVVRALALPMGLVDVKVCAVDAVWSGLKLVRRKALRTPRR